MTRFANRERRAQLPKSGIHRIFVNALNRNHRRAVRRRSGTPTGELPDRYSGRHAVAAKGVERTVAPNAPQENA
jgi:hypothetical protein